jgi:serine/threonine-protein kinase
MEDTRSIMEKVPDQERRDRSERPTLREGPERARNDADEDGEPKAGAQIGRYVVERRLAGGGMGVVFRAFDPELSRPVAINLLRPEHASEDEVSRLRLRARRRR